MKKFIEAQVLKIIVSGQNHPYWAKIIVVRQKRHFNFGPINNSGSKH